MPTPLRNELTGFKAAIVCRFLRRRLPKAAVNDALVFLDVGGAAGMEQVYRAHYWEAKRRQDAARQRLVNRLLTGLRRGAFRLPGVRRVMQLLGLEG